MTSCVLQNFLDEDYEAPKITMVNNMIHNNEGYGVVLVRPAMTSEMKDASAQGTKGTKGIFLFLDETPKTNKSSIPRILDCIIHNLYLKFEAVMKYLTKE